MGERARLLESQAGCVQRRRATTSRPFPDSARNIVLGPQDTPPSPSPLSHPQTSSISFLQFFSDSHERLLLVFHQMWSVHSDPVSSAIHHSSGVLLTPTLTLAPALLSQIVYILQYIICLGCWSSLLPLRLLPSQIDIRTPEYGMAVSAVTEILQCTRRLPMLVT